jgi:hypothetical protein
MIVLYVNFLFHIWQKSLYFWFPDLFLEIFKIRRLPVPLEAYLYHRMVSCAPKKSRLGPMDLKIYTPSKNLATVTRQLTKSNDFL